MWTIVGSYCEIWVEITCYEFHRDEQAWRLKQLQSLEGEDSLRIEKGETLGLGVDTYTRRGYNMQKELKVLKWWTQHHSTWKITKTRQWPYLSWVLKMSCFHTLHMWMIPRRYGTSSKICMILTTQLDNLLLENKLYSMYIQRQLMFQISLKRLRRL